MSIELRIKSKHLATEPAIIKHEERKLKKQIKWLKDAGRQSEAEAKQLQLYSLIEHRRRNVAFESRATFLARAFIKGMPYRSVERNAQKDYTFNTYIFPRIVAMVSKYGTGSREDVMKWLMRAD